MEATISKRKSIFDTRFDTKKIFVTTRNRFSLRGYKNKYGNSLIYLDVSDSKKRIRLNTEIEIPAKSWDKKKQRIINLENATTLNLVLENIEAKLTTIKTTYMLQERFLDAKTLIEEFQTTSPNFDFIAFYRHHMHLQDAKPQTLKNQNSTLKKLEAFSPEIPFHKITMEFLQRYRKKYHYNSAVTYHSDLKSIKKYLRIAVKQGIKINIDLDDIKVNVDSNNTVYLMPAEVKKMVKYFYSEFINPSHVLPLGYFLFCCYTGLRISDIKKLSRKKVLEERFEFSSVKTDTFQYMKLNDEARKMVMSCPELFNDRIIDQTVNLSLKGIAETCKIEKNISMHVGRHTFATTFIRNKGDIYRLQKLLGHSDIRHTLKYVHIVNSEILDDLDLISY